MQIWHQLPRMKASLLSLCWGLAIALSATATEAGTVNTQSYNAAFPIDGRDWYESDNCPSWLTDYIKFHQETKGTAHAKYLVYSCHPDECYFGLGDRLRSILLFLRAAVASNRVLLIDITSPVLLTELFTPASINWTVGSLNHSRPTMPWKSGEQDNRTALLLSNAALSLPDKFVVVEGTGDVHIHSIVGAPSLQWAGEDAHCTHRALFKPSRGVQKEMVGLLRSMEMTPETSYVAVHLRFGGFIGEEEQVIRYHEMAALHTSIKCARHLADSHGMAKTDVVIITENMELKAMLLERGITHARTTNTTPVHTGTTQSHNLAVATFQQTVADMGILAGSACLVSDDSGGFGLQAMLWGGSAIAKGAIPPSCYISVTECLEKESLVKKLKDGGRKPSL